jgi:hypothetical protein
MTRPRVTYVLPGGAQETGAVRSETEHSYLVERPGGRLRTVAKERCVENPAVPPRGTAKRRKARPAKPVAGPRPKRFEAILRPVMAASSATWVVVDRRLAKDAWGRLAVRATCYSQADAELVARAFNRDLGEEW